jgi:hypothetical protein
MTVRNAVALRRPGGRPLYGIVAAGLFAVACQSPPPPGPPPGCVEESAWPGADEVAVAREQSCGDPSAAAAEFARSRREAYLESVCHEINAYRGASGSDPDLAAFDVRFPWSSFQWINAKGLDFTPDHHGSDSWADHLGLAGYHDNSIKRKRRAVMNALTFGLAQHWYDARGLGSPPDPD